MESITLGSVETLIVDVQDQVAGIVALPGGTTFEVRNDANLVVQSGAATTTGMRASCLINTTLVGYVVGRYRLYLAFASGMEIPKLLAGHFEVNP